MMTHPTENISPHTQTTAASNVTAAPPTPAQPDQDVTDATAHDSVPRDHKKDKNVVTRKPEYLDMSLIRADGGTQARVEINDATVKEYAEALREGAKFPPVVLYYKKSEDVYWLADGFHRFHAHSSIGSADILAEVKDGTWRDAMLHAVGANAAHGLRRTNADKRRAVQMLLDDPECVQWSDNAIAKACGVSQPFVASVRAAIFKPLEDGLTTPAENAAPATRTVTRNGTTYQQKVKAKPASSPVSPKSKESPLAAAAASAPALDAATDSSSTERTRHPIAGNDIDWLRTEFAACEIEVGEKEIENAALREEMTDLKIDLAVMRAEHDLLLRISVAGDKAMLDEFIRSMALTDKTEEPVPKAKAISYPDPVLYENARLHAEVGDLYARLQDRDAQLKSLTSEKDDLAAQPGDLAMMLQEAMTCHDEMRAILEAEVPPDEMPDQLRQARALSRMLESRVTEAPRRQVDAQSDQAGITQATAAETAARSEGYPDLNGVESFDCQLSNDDMTQAPADDERGANPDAAEVPEDDQQTAKSCNQ